MARREFPTSKAMLDILCQNDAWLRKALVDSIGEDIMGAKECIVTKVIPKGKKDKDSGHKDYKGIGCMDKTL